MSQKSRQKFAQTRLFFRFPDFEVGLGLGPLKGGNVCVCVSLKFVPAYWHSALIALQGGNAQNLLFGICQLILGHFLNQRAATLNRDQLKGATSGESQRQ